VPDYNKNTSLKFSFVSTLGNKRIVCNVPTSCREDLLGVFRQIAVPDSEVTLATKLIEYNKLSLNKLSVLATVNNVGCSEEEFLLQKEAIFFAKKVLNY
jgi:hypothetical protein